MPQIDRAGKPGEEFYYTIGDLTREFGVTSRTLRFYEDEGLLTPVREGQKRLYRRRDRARLKLILRGKRLGFNLAEIRETFELYEQARGESKQLHYYLQVLENKRAQLLQRQQDINDAIEELDQSYRQCQALLKERGELPG
jgi:DNA-binding transcriptional MerR regulator